MRKVLISLMFVLLFVVGSCGENSNKIDQKPEGSEGGPCYGNKTCDGDLVCKDGVCVDPEKVTDEDTGDTTDDGNTGNSGNSGDSGNTGDTGDSGDMVSVPAGSFWMGCNEAVEDKCRDEVKPYHAVTLSSYKIDKYEVTAGDYQKCVDAGDCNNDNEDEPHYREYSGDSVEKSYCNLGADGKSNHPMTCVSWYGAKAYCAWAGKRLPTEAEWEKAARGTEGAKYPWGNEDATCEYAIMCDSETDKCGCGTNSTWVVGSKEKGKSPYGAYDMTGNVWEWTNDWYGETYYETAPSENPTGPESGDKRVLRGDCWFNNGAEVYTRHSNLRHSTSYLYGFRCAK